VFSDAGDAEHPVSDASFDGWYEQHLGEILSIPGFTSAQRYELEEVTKPEGGTIPGRRLCIYTTSKPPAELSAEMERMNLLSADSYEKLKDIDSSGPALPQWWGSVRFAALEPDPDRRAHRGCSRGTVGGEPGSANGGLFLELYAQDQDVRRIGDCLAPRALDHALFEGARVGHAL